MGCWLFAARACARGWDERSGVADLEDAGAVFLDLFEADAVDLLELGEGAGALEDDAAQGGGAEDEELR